MKIRLSQDLEKWISSLTEAQISLTENLSSQIFSIGSHIMMYLAFL